MKHIILYISIAAAILIYFYSPLLALEKVDCACLKNPTQLETLNK